MRRIIVVAASAVLAICTSAGFARADNPGVLGPGLLPLPPPPAPPHISGRDVFGPGIGMDAYGRPTVVVPAFGRPGSVLGPVIPDVFGPGIGMDATGKPVIVVPKN